VIVVVAVIAPEETFIEEPTLLVIDVVIAYVPPLMLIVPLFIKEDPVVNVLPETVNTPVGLTTTELATEAVLFTVTVVPFEINTLSVAVGTAFLFHVLADSQFPFVIDTKGTSELLSPK
jgi:hypothetical protein